LGLGGQNVLDSLADKAMTTGDKNDVGHVVRVWAEEGEGEVSGEENRRARGEGTGFMGGSRVTASPCTWHITL